MHNHSVAEYTDNSNVAVQESLHSAITIVTRNFFISEIDTIQLRKICMEGKHLYM